MTKEKKESGFFKKLHHKYRLVIMNHDTLEEKLNVSLTRFNVFIFGGTMAIFLVIATIYLIAFTPLKEYIPGYADFNTRQVLRDLSLRADSLENNLRQKDLYILNIRNIIEGRDLVEEIPDSVSDPQSFAIQELSRSREDSLLRLEMELAAHFEDHGWERENSSPARSALNISFFAPLKGLISSHFDPGKGHYGIDVVADHNEIIKATLDGRVILSTWTIETGYTIGIQHANNIVSIYKHNSSLLKEQGNFVEAGEAIAVIGDTGLYSTGTHLHFELWFNGNPVNPADYISFQ
ncbi:MAG: M23 family metallopeptidase [Bacteroidia bacterium]|nr:MAG: M23 family metallopeptidase [Bacteroidia bacterium]